MHFVLHIIANNENLKSVRSRANLNMNSFATPKLKSSIDFLVRVQTFLNPLCSDPQGF